LLIKTGNRPRLSWAEGEEMTNRLAKWMRAEDDKLLALLDSKMDIAMIARKIKRTVSAIAKRRSILNKRGLVEIGLRVKAK
jgi:hypothetical protein